MSKEEITRLTRRFEGVRLEREEALRTIDRTNDVKEDLIGRIRRARVANATLYRKLHRRGDIVRIKNTLRDEYGITGEVILSP